jgi:hypothetical protein
MAVALALVLGSALLLSGQDSTTKRGLPKDWSMHHVVYSKPGGNVPAARLQKLLKDPRYILQQELRAAMAAPPSLPAPFFPEGDVGSDVTPPPAKGPLPRGLIKALIPASGKDAVQPTLQAHKHFHKDWSVGEGANGTTGVGQFPATFTGTAEPCITDYAVYNTGLGGSSAQATLVAFNNIYAACNSGVPTIYFAYNTGAATVATSVDLSADGTHIAFIQGNSGSAASLVVVGVANAGGSVSAPSTPASQPWLSPTVIAIPTPRRSTITPPTRSTSATISACYTGSPASSSELLPKQPPAAGRSRSVPPPRAARSAAPFMMPSVASSLWAITC